MKFSFFSDWLTDFCHAQFKQASNRSGYSLGVWGMGLFFLCLLNWKLLLALALGLAIAIIVYDTQSPSSWLQAKGNVMLRRWVKTPLGLASLSGGITSASLLLAMGLADATGRGWIAATLMLQAGTCLGIVGIWRSLSRRQLVSGTSAIPLFDRYISDLAHPNPMRRLIAIRRLQNQLLSFRLPAPQQRELKDYFQLLLTQEVNPLLRVALQDTLETCNFSESQRTLPQASAFSTLTVERSAAPVMRSLQNQPELSPH